MKSTMLLLVLLPLVVAHSWIHCTDYDRSGFNDNNYYNPSKCTGFGRGWHRNCEQHNNQFGVDCGFNQLNFNQICPFRLNPSNYFAEYSARSPMATYAPGEQVCLAWPAKNHVAASCANIFIPDTGTQIFMSGPNPQSDPANLNDLKGTRMIADFGRNTRADQYFAFQNCPKFCENNDKCLCTGCFNIPNDVQQGAIYSFYWAWAFNNVAETYTTCWEARIGGNGSPAPSPNPPPPPPTPNGDPCRNPSFGNGNGLIGEYFRGTSFQNYITERVDPRVSFNYGMGGPAGINNFDINFFTIRWLGQVQAKFAGDWTFYTISDDGCRLWVKGQMLVNDFNPHGVLQRSGTIFLNFGEKAGIKLEYLEVDQAASVQLQWSHRCEGQQDIPQGQLYATKQIGFDAQCAKYVGAGKGLVANYYNPSAPTTVVATQIEGPNDRKPENLPKVTLAAGWKVEYSGFILPSFDEEYTFFVTSQAGVRLTVNNVTIISNIVPHNSTEDTGKITLVQANPVPIFLEFWSSDAVNADNNPVLRWFTSVCQGDELIPREQFYTTMEEVPTQLAFEDNSAASGVVAVLSFALFLLF